MNEYLEELHHEIEQEQNIEDESDGEEVSPSRYDITSYGIDFDVEGVVRRVQKGDIYIPDFQRKFVWKMTESSRFIESLLLGLPVPGIFLAQDPESGKMLVIDGQQRLLTLKFFFDGYFNPKEDAAIKRVFKLSKVQEPYIDKTYETLNGKDRTNLGNCVIHSTVVKQDSPADDDTSIYHIFERLNSGGKKLAAQEIRIAVYHGHFLELLKTMNSNPAWRRIFGPENDRMRDQELILRFLAMLEGSQNYKKPMVDFLNKFLRRNRNPGTDELKRYHDIFVDTINAFHEALGHKIFRPARALNVAFFEASMVGLARRIASNVEIEQAKIKEAYDRLNDNLKFKELISQSTTDISNVSERLEIATTIFMEV
ncbi:MAG: DUF262 domain-containing protein [Candidatus Latescibacterota bacterium]